MQIIEYILDTIAPHECVGCGQEGRSFCNTCSLALPIIVSRCYSCQHPTEAFTTCVACRRSSFLYSVHPATTYQGHAKELVWRMKFERLSAGARSIAATLARSGFDSEELIVHVPTATSRVRQRGYDQAALIAKELARQTGLMYAPLLGRHGQHRQVGQSKKERKTQLKNMFLVTGEVRNKRIVLVDDVITTGATLEACAEVLRKASAAQIRAVVFAAV